MVSWHCVYTHKTYFSFENNLMFLLLFLVWIRNNFWTKNQVTTHTFNILGALSLYLHVVAARINAWLPKIFIGHKNVFAVKIILKKKTRQFRNDNNARNTIKSQILLLQFSQTKLNNLYFNGTAFTLTVTKTKK